MLAGFLLDLVNRFWFVPTVERVQFGFCNICLFIRSLILLTIELFEVLGTIRYDRLVPLLRDIKISLKFQKIFQEALKHS